ncbi:hypothetical protein BG011_004442 [Mortierella polycephala]|uniref:Uncharacterized protein n=1 Tax=Mortierella polycephala TaxID=41804 RepID=A0A9P6U2M6_9FUNG|nr:hypothetical protein BG011_004442 [Mortierella polycephala]
MSKKPIDVFNKHYYQHGLRFDSVTGLRVVFIPDIDQDWVNLNIVRGYRTAYLLRVIESLMCLRTFSAEDRERFLYGNANGNGDGDSQKGGGICFCGCKSSKHNSLFVGDSNNNNKNNKSSNNNNCHNDNDDDDDNVNDNNINNVNNNINSDSPYDGTVSIALRKCSFFPYQISESDMRRLRSVQILVPGPTSTIDGDLWRLNALYSHFQENQDIKIKVRGFKVKIKVKVKVEAHIRHNSVRCEPSEDGDISMEEEDRMNDEYEYESYNDGCVEEDDQRYYTPQQYHNKRLLHSDAVHKHEYDPNEKIYSSEDEDCSCNKGHEVSYATPVTDAEEAKDDFEDDFYGADGVDAVTGRPKLSVFPDRPQLHILLTEDEYYLRAEEEVQDYDIYVYMSDTEYGPHPPLPRCGRVASIQDTDAEFFKADEDDSDGNGGGDEDDEEDMDEAD